MKKLAAALYTESLATIVVDPETKAETFYLGTLLRGTPEEERVRFAVHAKNCLRAAQVFVDIMEELGVKGDI